MLTFNQLLNQFNPREDSTYLLSLTLLLFSVRCYFLFSEFFYFLLHGLFVLLLLVNILYSGFFFSAIISQHSDAVSNIEKKNFAFLIGNFIFITLCLIAYLLQSPLIPLLSIPFSIHALANEKNSIKYHFNNLKPGSHWILALFFLFILFTFRSNISKTNYQYDN